MTDFDQRFPQGSLEKYLRLFSYFGCEEANDLLLNINDPASNFLRGAKLKSQCERRDLDSFTEFQKGFIHEHPDRSIGLAFRGQTAPWPLRSKLDRYYGDLHAIQSKFPLPGPYRTNATYLEKAYERLRDFIASNGRTPDPQRDYILAVMQHYGAPTPLLDWTLDIDIALFFAFEDVPAYGHDRVAICIADIGKLHTMNYEAMCGRSPTVNDLLSDDYDIFRDSWTFVWPIAFGDIRFPVQQSVFLMEGEHSFTPATPSFETFLKQPPPYEPTFRPYPGTLLVVTLPATERAKVQQYLNDRNITRERLFGGWEDVVKKLVSDWTNDMLRSESFSDIIITQKEGEDIIQRSNRQPAN